MKKLVYIILIIALALVISFFVIQRTKTAEDAPASTETAETEITDAPEMSAAPVPTLEPTPEPTPEPTVDPFTYNDMYSSIYSHTDISDDARMENIRRAVEKINGIKIGPGETFSFNDALGSTADYNLAAVYDSRYPEDEVYEIGGGVSLVSSTLYCSSLYGCMDPVERYPHHFWLTSNGYLKRGMDAYVCNNGSGETVDLKIKNPFYSPVMIKAYLADDSDKLFVEFWGTNTEKWHAEPYYENYSLYLGGAYSYVCNRYMVENYRKVYNNDGFVREDDLNFDYDGDGAPDYDVYWWHDRDLVWEGGGH